MLLAIVLVMAMTPAAFVAGTVWGPDILTADAPSVWPTCLLVLMTAAMGLPFLRRVGLGRREVLTVYALVLVAAPLSSYTVLFYVIPKVIIYYHVARANPAWETAFIQHLPLWWGPTSELARSSFFLGKSHVPWGEWGLPMAAWGSFMTALFTATLCLLALLQRQWITHERIAFPLAQVPLETVCEAAPDEDGRAVRLPKSRLFWIGLALSGSIGTTNALASRYPMIPSIPIAWFALLRWQKVGPLAGVGEILLNLWPWFMGLIYLLPKEVLFSCWFFFVLRIALHVAAVAAGATPQQPDDWYASTFPAPYHQATGATMALGVWALWTARVHLRHVLRGVFRRDPVPEGRDEPLSHRAAAVGLALSVAWMVLFCWWSGCRLLFGIAFVAMLVGSYVVYARVRAETSLVPSVLDQSSVMTMVGGSAILKPQEIVTLLTMRWATFQSPSAIFAACPINALDSYKIADGARLDKRRLTRALGVTFLLALIVGIVVFLTGIYRVGYFDTAAGAANYWPSLQSRVGDPGTIYTWITASTSTDAAGTAFTVAGATICLLLGLLRLRFWWWPFHPIGYIIANGWGVTWYTVPFFVGWAAKSLVIRYGGLRLYRATVPLAIGLIIGDMLNRGLWSVINLVTRG
jgi:hypothetical protein